MPAFYAGYEAHPYKSERTMRAAMTRDMHKKAREVVTDVSKWDPRKNDLAGFDDGRFKRFTVPAKGTNVVKHAIANTGPLPITTKTKPPRPDPGAYPWN
jgi:hypothetical protein